MIIDLYANDGSPLGISPPTIYGRGVGGAELSMMTWAETMASRGHQVRVYNNPDHVGDYDGVEYLPQSVFNPGESRDVFITYRSPNPYTKSAKADLKIHWSTDQWTMGNFGTDIVPHVDAVVCISPYHQAYYTEKYTDANTIHKVGYIDLGVKLSDYEIDVEKVRNRCIFCSVPDRGLDVVRTIWPRIIEAIPDATLVITSDYTLWGAGPTNHRHRLNFLNVEGVSFVGAIPRKDLIAQQMEAEILLYPCTYEELFCISAAECQVAGAIPVTTSIGALSTTNEFGIQINGSPSDQGWIDNYTAQVIALMQSQDDQAAIRDEMTIAAKNRFRWDRICTEWESLFETGEFQYQALEMAA